MSENPVERQLQELEGLDAVDQINHWARMYREPDYEPQQARIPINEFYSAVMPRYSGWLIKQLVFVAIFAVIASLAGLGVKHSIDHRHAQSVLIEEEQLQISQLSGGIEDGTWWVEELQRYTHSIWGPEERINVFGGLEHHDYYSNLQNINEAHIAANRVFNRWPTRAGLSAIGVVAVLLISRRFWILNEGISAVRRLNGIVLAEDAKARMR